jgi:uncharacterized damage-inducible protein DinB
MEPILIEALRYNRWANVHLLDVCAGLSEDQLQLTAPGTYGTIAATLLHLVSAEQRYLRRFGAGEARISERDAFPGIAALREHAARNGDQLIEVAGRLNPDEAIEEKRDSGTVRLQLGVVLLQAIHHGNDHRTHVCTILGSNGVEYGNMDLWAYGQATGALAPVASSETRQQC